MSLSELWPRIKTEFPKISEIAQNIFLYLVLRICRSVILDTLIIKSKYQLILYPAILYIQSEFNSPYVIINMYF